MTTKTFETHHDGTMPPTIRAELAGAPQARRAVSQATGYRQLPCQP
ncbi:hypothetical protein [Corynebacterium glyciniphilum]|nr:hypothetical protein [Corynebacterium glyciniphilum]